MKLRFLSDATLKLILIALDHEPIKSIEKFPEDEESFKSCSESEKDPRNNSPVIVIICSKTLNQFEFQDNKILKRLKERKIWMYEKIFDEKFLSGVGWFS